MGIDERCVNNTVRLLTVGYMIDIGSVIVPDKMVVGIVVVL